MKTTLVACSVHPDIDGYASAVAYAEFLQKTDTYAVPGIFGILDEEVRYLLKEFNVPVPQGEMNPEYYDDFILVDASIVATIDRRIDPKKVIEIIDYRQANDGAAFPNARVQIEQVATVATLIGEKFRERKIMPSGHSAMFMFAAIASKTLNFNNKVATTRDLEVAKWLKAFVHTPDDFIHNMFVVKSNLAGERLKNKIQDKFVFTTLKGKKIGTMQLEMIGVNGLLEQRQEEVVDVLKVLKMSIKLDYIYLLLIDLEEGTTSVVGAEALEKEWLVKVLGGSLSDKTTKFNALITQTSLLERFKI